MWSTMQQCSLDQSFNRARSSLHASQCSCQHVNMLKERTLDQFEFLFGAYPIGKCVSASVISHTTVLQEKQVIAIDNTENCSTSCIAFFYLQLFRLTFRSLQGGPLPCHKWPLIMPQSDSGISTMNTTRNLVGACRVGCLNIFRFRDARRSSEFWKIQNWRSRSMTQEVRR